jgi:hypothetical protein
MGLREVFQAGASSAFSAFGNIKEPVSYYSASSNPTYNATTGAVTTGLTSETVNMIFIYYRREEIDNADMNVLATDIKGICVQSELSATPRIGDLVKRGSLTYRVEYFNQDPAGAMWKFKLRKG